MSKRTNRDQRSLSKYPALDKGLNLLSRKEYIEADYINGVYDSKGNQIIRPLTEEELKFLNQFYEETVVTNFTHNSDIKRLLRNKKKIVEDDQVIALKREIETLSADKATNKKRIKELKEIIKLLKKQNEETYAHKLRPIEKELKSTRKEKLLYPDKEDHKTFYNDNNARNSCIYNKANITKSLMNITEENQDLFYYKDCNDDGEELMIAEIERARIEEEEQRLAVIIEEERRELAEYFNNRNNNPNRSRNKSKSN